MLAAFEGWNDAGSAASDTLDHLHTAWDAQDLSSLDPEEYHDFQVNRPTIEADEDGHRELVWPTTTVSVAKVGRRKVVLAQGHEPSMRWRRFCDDLLDRAVAQQVHTVVTVGALLADVPHTRPIPVTMSSEDAKVRALLNLEPSTYEGPVGIVGVLAAEARRRGLATVAVWAAVPHYVAHPPSPKATLALLGGVEKLLGQSLEIGDLAEDARAWQQGVDELASEDTEIGEYVRHLEEAKDTADLPEASGEAIAQEFERYLRRRDPGTGI
ncbi:MAG: PAC2 family protein [Micrococcales bacterium]|nr:PAC2 family protein [Micrococcales bacterium]